MDILNKQTYQILILFIAFTTCLNLQLVSQIESNIAISNTDIDSTSYAPQTNRYGLLSSFSGKPGRAALVGLIVPSGGQFFNRRFIKGSIFLAAELAGIYYALDRSSYYREVDKCYKLRLQTLDDCINTTLSDVDINTLRNHRESVRESRDFAWLGLIIGHVFIVAEAFVDQHLMQFDVSDNLSIKFDAFQDGQLLTLSIPIQ